MMEPSFACIVNREYTDKNQQTSLTYHSNFLIFVFCDDMSPGGAVDYNACLFGSRRCHTLSWVGGHYHAFCACASSSSEKLLSHMYIIHTGIFCSKICRYFKNKVNL